MNKFNNPTPYVLFNIDRKDLCTIYEKSNVMFNPKHKKLKGFQKGNKRKK